jgi:hypothetical protein
LQIWPANADTAVMKWVSLLAVLLAVQAVPVISVSPDSGQPGAEFTVAGSEFTPDTRVKVLWDGTNLGGTVKVASDGSFRHRGIVPDGAASGSHSIQAVAVGGGTERATTTFLVAAIPGPTTTTQAPTTTQASTTTSPTTPTTLGAGAPVTTATAVEEVPASPTGAQGEVTSGSEGSETSQPRPGASTTGSFDAEGPTEASLASSARQEAETDRQSAEPRANSGAGPLGLLVLLVVVAGGGVAAYLLWGRSRTRPSVDEVDAESQIEPAGQVFLLPGDIEDRAGEWSRHMTDLEPPGEFASVVPTSAGWVGLGWTTGGEGSGEAAVWRSTDGITWMGASRFGRSGALLAAPWQSGLLVTVSQQHDPGVSTMCWFTEDGHDWEPLSQTSEESLEGVSFEGVAAIEEALVGWGRGPKGPGLWFTRDASDWEESSLQGEFDLIAPTDGERGELLAFGRDPKSRRPLVASSRDGVSWSDLGGENRAAFDGTSAASLVSFQGGKVLVGSDLIRGIGAVWVSDDGRGWYRVPFDPPPGTSLQYVSKVDDRLFALGSNTTRRRAGRGTAILWESRDAVTWERVAASELFSNAVASCVSATDSSVRIWGMLFHDQRESEAKPIPVTWECNPDRTRSEGASAGKDRRDSPADLEPEMTGDALAGRS